MCLFAGSRNNLCWRREKSIKWGLKKLNGAKAKRGSVIFQNGMGGFCVCFVFLVFFFGVVFVVAVK